jgi:DnaK suppressor protein
MSTTNTPMPHAGNGTPAAEAQPFTKADYDEFQALINAKLAEAQASLDLLRQTLLHKGSNGTDDTYVSSNIQEDGQATLEREEAARLAERQEKFIMQLNAALVRIQNRTYGICRATGKPISKDRLRAVPHATLSIGAKAGS